MWNKLNPPVVLQHLFESAPKVITAQTLQDLVDLPAEPRMQIISKSPTISPDRGA